MIVFDNIAGTINGIAYDYFKLIIVFVFEQKICGTNFVDKIQFELLGYGYHLCDQGSGLVAPGYGSRH